MARATHQATKDDITAAHANKPHALGPWVGVLSIKVGVSPALVADMFGTHEQTVLRWFRGTSVVPMEWMPKLARISTFLSWMIEDEWEPLHGTFAERQRQLVAAGKVFRKLTVAAGEKATRKPKD